MMKARAKWQLAVLTACLAAGTAAAQGYPTRPVTLINPYAAGGITDVAFRTIAAEAAKSLGQTILVENRTGAGGKIGANAIVAAAKDGYTVGIFNSGIGTNLPLMDPTFKMEPVRDYVPITRAIETYVVLVASPSAPYRDVKGLIDYARANPGKLDIGSAGVGTTGHLSLALLNSLAKLNLTHVPYKGETPMVTDVMGGQIPLGFISATVKPHVDAGKVIGIAVSGGQRWSVFPNLPSFQETGLNGFAASAWQGIVGPVGIPAEAVSRINRVVGTALQDAAVRKRLDELGLSVGASTPEEFTVFIRRELEVWGPVVRAANIKMD